MNQDPSVRSPPIAPPAVSPQQPLTWRAFAILAVIYLYSFPYFDQLRSANEMPRILMAQEIVERGTPRIDARVRDMRSTFDTSRGVGGHLYSNKAPGPSFLAVPVYAALKLVGATSLKVSTWAFRVFVVTVPSLLFLLLFYRVTAHFTRDEGARRLALLGYAVGSPALPYAVLFMSHQLAAICLGTAFALAIAVTREPTDRPSARARWFTLAVGALCGAAVLMDYQTLFIAPVIGLYTLARSRQRLVTLLLLTAGVLPMAFALGSYHAVNFGGPLTTPLGSSNETAVKSGFMGLIGPNRHALFTLLLDPSNGMFVLMPWTVFALVGFVAIMLDRRRRQQAGAEAITCLAVWLIYTAVLGSLVPNYARAGWTVGPRYMGAAFPFIGWLAAAGFQIAYLRLGTRVLAQALVIAAGAIFVVAASTFPHWPDGLRNPLFELAFRLPFRGYAAHSLGTAVGLKGVAALLPLYLLAVGGTIWIISAGSGRRAAGAALACVLAVALLTSYRAFPLTGPYSDRAWKYITTIWEPAPKLT